MWRVCPLAHIHSNVVFKSEHNATIMQLDAIVHVEGEGISGSTAYVVESSYHSPQLKEVQELKKKAAMFELWAKSDAHFESVTKVVAVLAGRLWPIETVDAAIAANQWRVQPSAAGYSVLRNLDTAA